MEGRGRRSGCPRLIFINKLDRERASFERTLEQLQEAFGAGVAPLELPIGEEGSFRGVADLLSDTAITYDGGKPTTGPIPEEMAVREHSVHDSLVEGIVVADDDLMERYLEGEVPTVKQLEKTLAHGVASGQVFPVVCGSALKQIALDRLASFICEIGPSPLDRPPVSVIAGEIDVRRRSRSCGSAAGVGVEDRRRPARGQDQPVQGAVRLGPPRRHPGQRPHPLRRAAARPLHPARQGADQRRRRFPPGTSGPWPSWPTWSPATPWHPRAPRSRVPGLTAPEPVLRIGIRPKSKGDEDKLMTALHRLEEEDPALYGATRRRDPPDAARWDGRDPPGIVTERLARKFGVEVETEPVVVPYRETITGSAEAEGKYKKQTGGHGQFGVAAPARRAASSAAPASSSSTRSSGARSPASSSPRCRRASRRRCPRAACTAGRWSTSGSPASTASTTRWTRRR